MNEFEIIQHPQIEGISLFFDTVDYRTPHFHPELELVLVLENELEVTFGPGTYTVTPGTPVLFVPNQPHEFHCPGGSCTFLCVQIDPRCFSRGFPGLEELVFDSPFPARWLSEGELCALRKTLFAVLRAYLEQPDCYQLFCMGQLGLVLHTLLTRMPTHRESAEEAADRLRRNARLERLLRFVDENYMHPVRLTDFARTEGRSMSHLSHFVKETMNQSFQEYVGMVRFNAACKLLRDGDKKLLDVCSEAGFSDYRYFSAAFRRRVGMTPEEYRRNVGAPVPAEKIHHSLHSLERFYSREKSLQLCEKYEAATL